MSEKSKSLIGGISVALLSLSTGLLFSVVEKLTMKHRTVST